MEEEYKRTIEAIKALDSYITVQEWNKLAKEFGFLNSVTLKTMSGMSFYHLYFKIKNPLKRK